MQKILLILGAITVSGALIGCGSGDDKASPPAASADASVDASVDAVTTDVTVPTPSACPTIVSDTACDTTKRPFVFVHGTYGSGDNFENVAALLASNGYCADHIVRVEYNSLGDNPGNDCTAPNTPQGCGKIEAAVTAILAKFPQFTQVDLGGHSQGTEHCGIFIGAGGVGAHADQVAHYFNFSGVPNVGNVPTLSLSSQHDLMDTPHHATGTSICAFAEEADGGTVAVDDGGVAEGGAGDDGGPGCNVIQYTFVHQDHFAVAASKGSFIQVYKYLNGKDPQYTDIQCGDDPVTVEGLSETFADNVPVLGKIEVREVTTPRADGPPEQTIMPDSAGHFLAMLKRNVFYEFAGYNTAGTLIGYQYFTPFKRSNRLMSFLSPASSTDGTSVGGTIASLTTNKATRSPNSVTLVTRWAGGAFRQDLGATLLVNGSNVLTTDNSGTAAFSNSSLNGGVVGLFMEDKNMNMMSDLGLVDSAPFIAFTDVYMSAATPNFVQMSFTPGIEDTDTVGNTAVLSNWPSNAALINVFFQ
ncbi:MAG: esterase/lipase family protein [Polyangiaceae bacterium]